MPSITTPPIKSQGIKTKLVPWINDLILSAGVDLNSRWIEPFFGTGVVGFNSPLQGSHIGGDTNPQIINFYQCIQRGEITPDSMRAYLIKEGRMLAESADHGYAHFRLVRDRFNFEHSPYDFIFLCTMKHEFHHVFLPSGCTFPLAYISVHCTQSCQNTQ